MKIFQPVLQDLQCYNTQPHFMKCLSYYIHCQNWCFNSLENLKLSDNLFKRTKSKRIIFVCLFFLLLLCWIRKNMLLKNVCFMLFWIYYWQTETQSNLLEKILMIIKSSHHLTIPWPPLNHVPKWHRNSHLHTSLKYFQRWCLHHFPTQPVQMLNQSFLE